MRTAFVTGASRGIGAGIALVLASEGYDLAISYQSNEEQAEAVAERIRTRTGRRCLVLRGDMSKPDTPREIVASAIRGLDHLDLLVNNAGYTKFDNHLSFDVDEITRLMTVDFRAYYVASITAAAHMVDRGIRGSIVNITSSRAERAYPDDAVYGGMKAAVRRATESLAVRYAAHGIRINCVAPGATVVREAPAFREFYESLAPRIPLKRIGTPEDIGNAVAWLASGKASYITGVTLRVDGGLILPGMPEHKRENPDDGWDRYIGESGQREDLQ